ncbi:DUF885 domain-containing protein [Aliikangiella sp. IMCC44632]
MKLLLSFLGILAITSCTSNSTIETTKNTDNLAIESNETVITVANEYLALYSKRYATTSSRIGVPGTDHSQMDDNSSSMILAWKESSRKWESQLSLVSGAELTDENRELFSNLRYLVNKSIRLESCKSELWRLNHALGWHIMMPLSLNHQPLETSSDKDKAIKRWSGFDKYIDNEIENLKVGLSMSLTTPRPVVIRLVEQLESMTKDTVSSPFYKLANKTSDEEFKKKWEKVIREKINPSLLRFKSFLSKEYLPQARTTISIKGIPLDSPEDCYKSMLYSAISKDVNINEIYMLGSKFEKDIQEESKSFFKKMFGKTEAKDIYPLLRSEKYKFKSEQEVLDVANAYLKKAIEMSRAFFHDIPDSPFIIESIPEHEKGSTPRASYIGSAENSGEPAKIRLNTDLQTQYRLQSIIMHEGVPGHHMQFSQTRTQQSGKHFISKVFYPSSFVEGWGLYAEKLAYDNGFYDSYGKLGFFIARGISFRAARIDLGINHLGWTRDEAIEFLINLNYERANASVIVDQITAMPTYGMPYIMGLLELERLENLSRERLGDNFNIKNFHHEILSGGSIPLEDLDLHIRKWIKTTLEGNE